ncbi:hypothetical protein SPI_09372 [Niveomyces insectorum RCEF 264]|uniref:Uncharacterized protein n=1 Tax=Niveomyces insectorum RCEF 264 TaxID=1081102 RepID=A0A167LSF7_9HYPO|nr:hypothetical protein SPI_09372 [Niveomyces insectorum RCEF 264]
MATSFPARGSAFQAFSALVDGPSGGGGGGGNERPDAALGLSAFGGFKPLDARLGGSQVLEVPPAGQPRQPDLQLDAYRVWSRLVETGRNGDDDDENNNAYLAGLWRRHLPYHLLWWCQRDGDEGDSEFEGTDDEGIEDDEDDEHYEAGGDENEDNQI